MDETLKALQAGLEKAQSDMGQVLDQAGENLDFKKVSCVSGTDEEKAAAFRKMNDTCSDFQKKVDSRRQELAAKEAYEKRALIGKVAQPSAKGSEKKDEYKGEPTLGDAVLKAAGIDGGEHGRVEKTIKEHFWNKEIEVPLGVNLKTLFETGAGWAAETLRTGRVIDKAARPIQVIDLIPAGSTGQAAVVYMEETTLDESLVVETSEGGSYGEAQYALTERSETVRKIAGFLPVTDEQLEDVPQVRGYINNRLPMALKRRLDGQIVNGDGNAPNLTGILNKASIQTYNQNAVASDVAVDALRRAITLVRVTGRAFPNGVIMHPDDWEEIRLMKTNDGAYIWGHPSEAGLERVWGLPVAQADQLAENTAIVADFMFSELAERRGIVVKISDSHSDYFIKGKQAIRADMRVAFVIYRAAAFCKVTLTA